MNIKELDSLIFDVDGTIWDTTPVVAPAWNNALIECGLSEYAHLTADDLKKLFGKPMNIIIEAILPDQSPEKRLEFEKVCYIHEEDVVANIGGKLYPHIRETIEALSKKYNLYIVSNCQSGYIETMLRVTKMEQFFKDHACYGDEGLLKDQNIRLIVERNNLKNPAYIGDTQGDADATAKAGLPFIHVTYGFGKVKDADCSINDIAELLTL
ncbi:MAG: HAD family hydrolase [Treponema sp.]|nr:HAD family hydrolase [Treponema sp.]